MLRMQKTPIVTEQTRQYFDFPKVELHVHLDGSIRHSTLLELAKAKKIGGLKDANTIEDVRNAVMTTEPSDLSTVLAPFDQFFPLIIGDKEAQERIAYELCETQARDGVVYFEAQVTPHLSSNTTNHKHMSYVYKDKGDVTPLDALEAVARGFKRGEHDFGVKARILLCAICGYSEWTTELLQFALNYRHLGVVGINIAGCANGAGEQYEPDTVECFKEAARLGIHRSIHAGESGGPEIVRQAIEEMKAERIGHGYRLLKDERLYQKYLIEQRNIHLEACPLSSVMTGGADLDWLKHPVKRWAQDDVNFSLNTDDPTCFGNSMLSELKLAYEQIGLTKHQIWKCQLNAAQSCFLPYEEREEVIKLVKAGEPLNETKLS